jgi:hypothetical protein
MSKTKLKAFAVTGNEGNYWVGDVVRYSKWRNKNKSRKSFLFTAEIKFDGETHFVNIEADTKIEFQDKLVKFVMDLERGAY